MRRYLIFLYVLSYSIAVCQSTEIELNANWKFRQTDSVNFHIATVPGTVHTDLYYNKLIKDPFYSNNEISLQWIENKDWEYIGTFNCDNNVLQNRHIELNFEGLDTYAKVFLNGQQILECNNMFRSWNVEVKNYLKNGNNTLRIVFESSVKKGKADAAKLPYTLPGDEKVFTRKAQYQYGWDWGPRFVTCGIYKPIKLITWNDFKMTSVSHIIPKVNGSKTTVKFILEIESNVDSIIEIGMNALHNLKFPQDFQSKQNVKIHLQKGKNIDTIDYLFNRPHLWYTNGINKYPACYQFSLSLISKKQNIKLKQLTIGLRTLELIRDKDSIGESFYFKLNGKKVFMKGANYIPQDNFVSSVKTRDYQKIIQMAKDANMNMLRVWGGGIYPDDEFYEECDRNGILVWQDFMFACAMYPGDSAFVENVKQEVTQQVKRLQNHPCLALWCGNNEVDEGWKNWGWQKQFKYSPQDSTKIWNDYKNIFHDVLPSVVKKNNPEMPYWSSSPSIGWGHKESLQQGDSHYWGVWWGMEPFEMYEKKVGRFMSEYGFQGMPDMNTLKMVCDTLSLISNAVKAHQKHPKGFETIQTYMERKYKVPSDFEKYNYVSQLVQRDGLKTAIEAHRRAMPYCMGTLYWQLNDCWPVTSWSSIDYNFRPKASYYETKKLYHDILISVNHEKDVYNIFMISDKLNDEHCELEVCFKNMKGEMLFQKKDSVTLKSNSSHIYFSLSENELIKYNKNEMYLSCNLKNRNGEMLSNTNYCFVEPKYLELVDPKIEIEFSKTSNSIFITSMAFVKDFYLQPIDSSIELNTNFIDLEPNFKIELTPTKKLINYTEIKYFSLYDINK